MSCAICYNKSNYITECNHDFCIRCLRKWDSHSCPMCRQRIHIPYPNTRSAAKEYWTCLNVRFLLNRFNSNISVQQKAKIMEEILIYIWNHRVLFRRRQSFHRMIKKKCKEWHAEFIFEKVTPPRILKQFSKF